MKLYTGKVTRKQNQKENFKYIDITVKSGNKLFAPIWNMVMDFKNNKISWENYSIQYVNLMRNSYFNNNEQWINFLMENKDENLVICCYCTDSDICHRSLLTDIFKAVCNIIDIECEIMGEI